MKIATLGLLLLLFSLCQGQPAEAPNASGASTWKVSLVSAEEPGEPLIVSGVVYASDGRTPVPDVSIYVYQTDVKGYYAPNDARASDKPRLHGRMRTGANGKYEFRTIKPGSYPSTRAPAHIHYVVSAPGYKEKIFEIIFEDDPFVTEQIRADAQRAQSIYSLRPLRRDAQGVLHCEQNITFQR